MPLFTFQANFSFFNPAFLELTAGNSFFNPALYSSFDIGLPLGTLNPILYLLRGSSALRSELSYKIGELAGSTYAAPGQKYVDVDEVFYDSLAPNIVEIAAVEGAIPAYFEANNFFGKSASGSFYLLNSDLSSSLTITGIKEWNSSYPFDGKYSGINRMLFQSAKAALSIDGNNTSSFSFVENKNFSFILTTPQTSSFQYLLDQNLNDSSSFYTPTSYDLNKFFFGFGTNKESYNFPDCREQLVTGSSPVYVASIGPRPAGWKYGLINGNLLATSCIFRKGHFGHFRDMLEQRPFSVFTSTVVPVPRDGPVHVRFMGRNNDGTYYEIDPEKTMSHNLSPHATSSVPYVDGEYFDRVYDPATMLINNNFFITP